MAVYRPTPQCPFCGAPIAEAIHQNYDGVSIYDIPIGDSFIGWRDIPHSCPEKEKYEEDHKADNEALREKFREILEKGVKSKKTVDVPPERKRKEMSDKQFDEFAFEVIPQQLFHVESTDIDDETGASLEEVILVQLIAAHPECLKHKSLKWFITNYLNWDELMK